MDVLLVVCTEVYTVQLVQDSNDRSQIERTRVGESCGRC